MIGCSDTKTKDSDSKKNVIESERSEKEYPNAVKSAESNNPEGLLQLYEIASKSISAETSEIARDKLLHILYSKPELWIRTFSKTDLESFKRYLKTGGMAILELPKGVESEEQYEQEIVKKLSKIRGDEKEMELINYILELYGRKR
jgi:hypothetical protein